MGVGGLIGKGSAMRSLLACLCVVCVFLPAAAGADDEPVVAIRTLSIRAAVHGRLATTTIELTYVNYSREAQEALCTLKLPEPAAVHGLALWVAGRRVPGEILPQAQAKEIYREIVEGKRDPALLVYQGDGVWSLRVFPVPPQQTQKVEVRCTHVLGLRDGRIVYESPVLHGPAGGQAAQELEFSARVAVGGGIADIQAGRKSLGVERLGPEAVVLGRREEGAALDQPLGFTIRPRTKPAAVLCCRTQAGKGYFLTELPSPAAPDRAGKRLRDFVFVLDASASMAGRRFAIASAAVREAVNQLVPGERFTIIAAGAEPKAWRAKLADLTDAATAQARRFVEALKPAGGTDLAGALRMAESLNTDPKRPFYIFLVTDGQDRVGAEPPPVRPLLATQPAGKTAPKPQRAAKPAVADFKPAPNAHVFALSVGGDSEALSRLAERTSGLCLATHQRGHAMACVRAAMLAAEVPVVAGIEVEVARAEAAWPAVKVSRLAHTRPPRGEPILLAGAFSGAGNLVVKVTANVDGHRISRSHALTVPASAEAVDGLAWARPGMVKVWAHLWAEQMWRKLHAAEPRLADLAALVRLSQTHHVGTRATALLVLETDQEYLSRGLRRAPSVLGPGASLAERRKEKTSWGRIDPWEANVVTQEARVLRGRSRELIRQKRFDLAANAMRGLCDLRPGDADLHLEAAILRDFVKLWDSWRPESRAAEPADADPHARRAWHGLLCPPGPVDVVPEGPVRTAAASLPGPDRRAFELLRRKLPAFKAARTRLADALRHFSRSTGLGVRVQWASLADEEITKDAKVTCDLENVRADGALRALLGSLGADTDATFVVDDGVVVVCSPWDQAYRTKMRVYDVRDLARRFPTLPERLRQMLTFDNKANRAARGGGLFGGGLFGDDDDDEEALSARPVPWRLPRIDLSRNVVDLTMTVPDFQGPKARLSRLPPGSVLEPIVADNIALEDWRTRGPYGAVQDLGGILLVTQSLANHMALVELLDGLRAATGDDADRPPSAEALFTTDRRIAAWVAELLRRAREGKLSKFSSVLVRKMAGRALARIGGVWFDVSIGERARIQLVQRGTAAERAVREAAGKLEACLDLPGCVVLAAGADQAVCLDTVGVSKADDPALRKVLAGLRR